MMCFRWNTAMGLRFKDNVWTRMRSHHRRTLLARHQLLSPLKHKDTYTKTPQHTRCLKGANTCWSKGGCGSGSIPFFPLLTYSAHTCCLGSLVFAFKYRSNLQLDADRSLAQCQRESLWTTPPPLSPQGASQTNPRPVWFNFTSRDIYRSEPQIQSKPYTEKHMWESETKRNKGDI